MNNGETRREFLQEAALLAGAVVAGVDIFSSAEAEAKKPVEVKREGNKIRFIGRGDNLNQLHTDVYNKCILVVGTELKRGSYIMSNFRINLSKSGKEFVLEYSVDLNPVDKTNPNIQDAFQIVGKIEINKNEVQTSNQEKKAAWISDNKGTKVSRFWEETAETECDGWYHQAIILKAQSM